MGPDRAKQFMKKNADAIPAGESVRGVLIVETKGGAWRRGLSDAGGVIPGVAAELVGRNADDARTGGGAAARWPEGSLFWAVITDRQLHVFEGLPNSQKLGSGAAHYPLADVARMDYEKKLLISKLTVHFADGSAVELDVSKQKVQPFVDAISAAA